MLVTDSTHMVVLVAFAHLRSGIFTGPFCCAGCCCTPAVRRTFTIRLVYVSSVPFSFTF